MSRRKDSQLQKAITYSIIAFWGVMAIMFARREIIPWVYAQPLHGYAGIRSYAETHVGYRMRICAPDGSQIGETETMFHPKDDRDWEITTRATIDVGRHSMSWLFGIPQIRANTKVELTSEVTVGADNRFKSFRTACGAPGFNVFASGEVSGSVLHMTIDLGGSRIERDVPVTPDDVISAGMMSLGVLPDLHVGDTLRLKTLDLKVFELVDAYARVIRKTRILLRGEWYPVHEVELSQGTTVVRLWVSESGEVLKEEVFGLVLIRDPLPHEEGPAQAPEPARN